jgi:hypothetical protein
VIVYFNKRDAFYVVVISSLMFVTYRSVLFECVGGYWCFRGDVCPFRFFKLFFPVPSSIS